jgi:hypothetical protein
MDDAISDMTGFVSEKVTIQEKGQYQEKSLGTRDEFWEKMVKVQKEKGMMGCSITGTGGEGKVMVKGQFTGLISGHAYSIQGLYEIKVNCL